MQPFNNYSSQQQYDYFIPPGSSQLNSQCMLQPQQIPPQQLHPQQLQLPHQQSQSQQHPQFLPRLPSFNEIDQYNQAQKPQLSLPPPIAIINSASKYSNTAKQFYPSSSNTASSNTSIMSTNGSLSSSLPSISSILPSILKNGGSNSPPILSNSFIAPTNYNTHVHHLNQQNPKILTNPNSLKQPSLTPSTSTTASTSSVPMNSSASLSPAASMPDDDSRQQKNMPNDSVSRSSSSSSSSSNSSNNNKLTKYSRTKKACDLCNQKRTKCSGDLPRCFQCVKINSVCTYMRKEKKRGRASSNYPKIIIRRKPTKKQQLEEERKRMMNLAADNLNQSAANGNISNISKDITTAPTNSNNNTGAFVRILNDMPH